MTFNIPHHGFNHLIDEMTLEDREKILNTGLQLSKAILKIQIWRSAQFISLRSSVLRVIPMLPIRIPGSPGWHPCSSTMLFL